MATTAESKITTDHEEIRRWAEERGAQPACVKGTGAEGDIGMLRLDFPGFSGEDSLQHISWDDWFQKFDERNLALLHQEKTARGQKSNFNKLMSRETAEAAEQRPRSRSHRTAAKKTSGRSASKKKSASTSTRKTAAKKSASRGAGVRSASSRKSGAKSNSRSGTSGSRSRRSSSSVARRGSSRSR